MLMNTFACFLNLCDRSNETPIPIGRNHYENAIFGEVERKEVQTRGIALKTVEKSDEAGINEIPKK